LFYRKDDAALAQATTFSEVEAALGTCTYTSEIPPDRRGLMIDMAGGTTDATLYLDAVENRTGRLPPELPWTAAEIEPAAMDHLRRLLAMASYENGLARPAAPYARGKWFSQGWGRAFVGFAESMSVMSPETRAGLGFKVMPLADDDRASLFYADVVAVHPATKVWGTRELAVELANLLASHEVMVRSLGPGEGDPSPQYLMAARPSVFETLGRSFPIYGELHELIETSHPTLFRLGPRSREWLAAMKDTLRKEAREDYPCGCDVRSAELIRDAASAPALCQAACRELGGWSGKWTNEAPATPPGTSACGCRACPAP
ncbi:MAG: thiamine pyridinylase, partial [Acidobacteria bacterium]|nr:thiamine pyridinylase [Acidobacteriota bacterium]